jgi:hypothetical protein
MSEVRPVFIYYAHPMWLYGKPQEEELLEIGEDPSDLGGCFIINGLDRIIAPEHFITAVLAGFAGYGTIGLGGCINSWKKKTEKNNKKIYYYSQYTAKYYAQLYSPNFRSCLHRYK